MVTRVELNANPNPIVSKMQNAGLKILIFTMSLWHITFTE